jgi:fatty acid desaturase
VYYDFTEFSHPGGAEILALARDRFEDCTYAFESHHLNYKRARAIIAKYAVDAETQALETARRISSTGRVKVPQLLPDSSFYSDVRLRVLAHMKAKHNLCGPAFPPKRSCLLLFYACLLAWALCLYALVYVSPTLPTAVLCGVLASFLGAFGHNFVHQPTHRHLAFLSLDTIGFSSSGWYREHVLQHHMYTNTPLDNHWKGTDPFIVTDSTVARNAFQATVSPLINPFFLTFGLWGNYIAHLVEMLRGHEAVTLPSLLGKALLPLVCYLTIAANGLLSGLALLYAYNGTIGIYYFTMALMNHNSEKTVTVERRNANVDDWGKQQISSCADWGVQEGFWWSMRYLWLNYHCVHHLFPLIDFSYHQEIQVILMEACRDHKVEYEAGEFWDIYGQMVRGFGTPRSLGEEVFLYCGS